jgi:hypothetical protein
MAKVCPKVLDHRAPNGPFSRLDLLLYARVISNALFPMSGV